MRPVSALWWKHLVQSIWLTVCLAILYMFHISNQNLLLIYYQVLFINIYKNIKTGTHVCIKSMQMHFVMLSVCFKMFFLYSLQDRLGVLRQWYLHRLKQAVALVKPGTLKRPHRAGVSQCRTSLSPSVLLHIMHIMMTHQYHKFCKQKSRKWWWWVGVT